LEKSFRPSIGEKREAVFPRANFISTKKHNFFTKISDIPYGNVRGNATENLRKMHEKTKE